MTKGIFSDVHAAGKNGRWEFLTSPVGEVARSAGRVSAAAGKRFAACAAFFIFPTHPLPPPHTPPLPLRGCPRPWRGNVVGGRCDFSEPLYRPTLAAPLPPSYEEGAPRPRRVRLFETVPVSQPLLPLPGRGGAKRRGGSVYPTAQITAPASVPEPSPRGGCARRRASRAQPPRSGGS